MFTLSPKFSSEMLIEIMPYIPKENISIYHKWLFREMLDADISTIERMACFLGQLRLESGCLKYWYEIAPKNVDPKIYFEEKYGLGKRFLPDGSIQYFHTRLSKSLGNVEPGDGWKYCGHGPLQTTGRRNHDLVSKAAYKRGKIPTETYYIDNPLELTKPEHGFFAATFYWVSNNLNQYADTMDIEKISHIINRGPWEVEYDLDEGKKKYALSRINHLEERIKYSNLALDVFKKFNK
jgi:predicted chitinase